jgi:hypothetical protein
MSVRAAWNSAASDHTRSAGDVTAAVEVGVADAVDVGNSTLRVAEDGAIVNPRRSPRLRTEPDYLPLLAGALLLAACSTYGPRPPAQPAFLSRTQTETQGGVRASVAALGAKESKEYFGVNLAAKGIQPLWVQIENGGAVPLYLLLSSVDPAYFSAREAAYQMHSWFGGSDNQRIDEYLDAQAIDGSIPAGATRAGFVFTNLDEKVKYVTVQLFGPRVTLAFYFLVDAPGVRTDYDLVDFDALYRPDEIVDLESEDELRAALERLPPYTTRTDGTGRGDGLNFVLIATSDEVGGTLVASGWQVTEAFGAGSGWRTFKAFLFGGRYRYAPMSPLYVFGRRQDAGFQKARDSIRRRNHLRLWLTPLRFQGREIWLGAISRDIGVYFTPRPGTSRRTPSIPTSTRPARRSSRTSCCPRPCVSSATLPGSAQPPRLPPIAT